MRVNGVLCPGVGSVQPGGPAPVAPACGFAVPAEALQPGYNVVEVKTSEPATIVWVELMFNEERTNR